MKRFLRPFAAASALLLPSCQWNIGELIRADSAVYVGGDVRKPVNGLVYRDEDGNLYAWVPEVTYCTQPELAEFVGMGPSPHKVQNLHPTGRTILVRIGGAGMRAPEKLKTLPEGAKPSCMSKGEWPMPLLPGLSSSQSPQSRQQTSTPDDMLARWTSLYPESDHRWLGDFDGEGATRGSFGAQALAAPFDYVIDPALSVVSTPFWMLGFLTCAAWTGH